MNDGGAMNRDFIRENTARCTLVHCEDGVTLSWPRAGHVRKTMSVCFALLAKVLAIPDMIKG